MVFYLYLSCCGVWCVVCGVWLVCGVWCVVCGVWCAPSPTHVINQ